MKFSLVRFDESKKTKTVKIFPVQTSRDSKMSLLKTTMAMVLDITQPPVTLLTILDVVLIFLFRPLNLCNNNPYIH